MMHYWRFGWGGSWLMMLVWIALIVGVIYLLINRNKTTMVNGNYGQNRALDILQERLAKGDITEEEYRRRKELLRRE